MTPTIQQEQRKKSMKNRKPQVEFYICPNHIRTGGWESCCVCGGWKSDDPDYGKLCTEEIEDQIRRAKEKTDGK